MPFPVSPVNSQTYTTASGTEYTYTNGAWRLSLSATPLYAVDVLAPLTGNGTAASPLNVSPASTDDAGVIELATSAETSAGASTTLAVSPSTLISESGEVLREGISRVADATAAEIAALDGTEDLTIRLADGTLRRVDAQDLVNAVIDVETPLNTTTSAWLYAGNSPGAGFSLPAGPTTNGYWTMTLQNATVFLSAGTGYVTTNTTGARIAIVTPGAFLVPGDTINYDFTGFWTRTP